MCLSPSEFLFYKVQKPTLRKPVTNSPIKIHMNLKVDSSEVLEELVLALNSIARSTPRFKLQLSALDLSQLSCKRGNLTTRKTTSQSTTELISNLDMSELETAIIPGDLPISDDEDDLLLQPSCLWFLLEHTTNTSLLTKALTTSKRLRSLLISVSASTGMTTLKAIVNGRNTNLTTLGVFGGTNSTEHYHKLGTCLQSLSSTLEFLYLKSWKPTYLPLQSLSACTSLRVLSVITGFVTFGDCEDPCTFSQLLQALTSLKSLEYVELEQVIDLNAGDLAQLRSVVRNSLPQLSHCHLHVNSLVLRRSDLDVPEHSVVHQLIRSFLTIKPNGHSMLYRSPESFQICQKGQANSLMVKWLSSLRAQTCFRLGMDVWVSSSLLYTNSTGI